MRAGRDLKFQKRFFIIAFPLSVAMATLCASLEFVFGVMIGALLAWPFYKGSPWIIPPILCMVLFGFVTSFHFDFFAGVSAAIILFRAWIKPLKSEKLDRKPDSSNDK